MTEQPGMTHRVDSDGILRVHFDTPGERVNLLTGVLLRSMAELLDAARRRDDVRAVLFASAKPDMFIAGMDVEEIGGVTDAYRAAEGARYGQAVFHKIAELGKPSACAIAGPCMGGGTEMALACTFRLASDDRSVRIGLPEVKLGIIPGFGGCQRLPRLVGLPAALDLILTGRGLNGRQARKIGLVDGVVPAAYLERQCLDLLRRALADGVEATTAKVRRGPGIMARMVGSVPPVRRFVLDQARKRTAKKVSPEHYPAPFRALEAIEAALTLPLPQGLDIEARIVGELIPTQTTKNLIWLFKSQAALKGEGAGVRAVPRGVRSVSVLGAGIMGGGIAQLVAHRGIPVRLKDLQYEAILTALRTAHGVWDRQRRRRRLDARELRQKMGFIAPTLDDTGLKRVDLVIEAVVEDLEVKRKVLAGVEQRIDERAVFATNTSSLPIADIAAGALRPERVVGMHFFNPVHRMPLVEVIAGPRSSPEAVATVHALAARLGKVPVIVKDGPGFLVNRILTLYLNEALQLLKEGVRIPAVDQAMVAFGMPMGPFALLDQIGLDVALHVAKVLQAAFGERIGAGGEESVIQVLVSAGKLGLKNGRGFYRYRSGRRTTEDGETYNLVGSPSTRELPPETLQERMVLAMVNEAVVCLQEGMVRGPREIDMAMVMGTGFPPFRGGLLRHADSVGIPIVADRLGRLADAQGERFRPAGLWAEMVREQRRFY
jgi:3-hydroxyacyl-CoA dehydrogenase/enoyl-CoA hydratase/3-hydroxybutyryl-CoA epimerase